MFFNCNGLELLGYSNPVNINEMANNILSFNLKHQINYYSERTQSEYDILNSLYRESRHIEEDECNVIEDFYQWLTDIIDNYTAKTNTRYPIAIDSNRGTINYIIDSIIDVLSYICTDYINNFDKKDQAYLSGFEIKLLSEKSEKKYKDLINFIYKEADNYNYKIKEYCKSHSIQQTLTDAFSQFVDVSDEMSRFPMYDRTWDSECFSFLFFEDIESFNRDTLHDPITQKVIKTACTIFFEMKKSSILIKSDLFDRLTKLIALYYKVDETYRLCNYEALYFFSETIQRIINDEEPEVMENAFKGFDNVCEFYEYPDSAKKAIAHATNRRDHSEYSTEAIDSAYNFGKTQLQSNVYNTQNFAVNKIDDKYKAKFSKLNNIWNEVFKIKPSKMKAKFNSAYFKKWYGRIPSMYSRYGGEATITENKMKGDPTLILANSAPKYLANLVTETNKMFQDMIDLSKRIASASDINSKLNIVKSFCSNYAIEDPRDPKMIELSIKNEAMLRISKCIFQGNDIYGYSPEGIVENGKFPTANHIVTSLFIENANEEPKEQSVNEVFSTPDSLTVFAHPQKLAAFDELFKKTSNSISQGFNHKIVSDVHNNMELNFKNYANSLKRKSDDIEGGDADEASLNKKLAKSIENGIVDGLDLAIDQKARCMQISSAMYDMLGRVQRLAKLCVSALHQAEVQHGDTRMNTGINNKIRNSSNIVTNHTNKVNSASRYKENLFTYK